MVPLLVYLAVSLTVGALLLTRLLSRRWRLAILFVAISLAWLAFGLWFIDWIAQ